MSFYTVNCFFIENINWEKEPLFEIFEHTICIWQIKIVPDLNRIENLSALLNQDELARANRYHYEKDRKRFVTSRGALRLLLSRYLKKEPADIEFAVSHNKKPFLKQPLTSLHYNTSHSENYVLIAIANSEVGIDVEKIDTSFGWEEILHSSFSKDEISWVEQSKTPKDSFYLLWTRKEALAKATGKGLQDDLSIFPSLEGIHNLYSNEFSCSWKVNSFKIDNSNVGSVAYQPPITNRKFFSLDFKNFEL